MRERGADKPGPDGQGETGRILAVRLRNARSEPMWYSVEPWGEGYDLPPGNALKFLSDGPNGDYTVVDSTVAR